MIVYKKSTNIFEHIRSKALIQFGKRLNFEKEKILYEKEVFAQITGPACSKKVLVIKKR